MSYQDKYLKYKQKYLELKTQLGSGSREFVYKRNREHKIISQITNPLHLTIGDKFIFIGNLYEDTNEIAITIITYTIKSIDGNNIKINVFITFNFNDKSMNDFKGTIESPDFKIIDGIVQPYTTNLVTIPSVIIPYSSINYQITGDGIGKISYLTEKIVDHVTEINQPLLAKS